MPQRILNGLDDVCAFLAKRTASTQYRSPVSIILGEGDRPSLLAYDPEPSNDTRPVIDEARVSAKFTISTPALDRHNDRVRPEAFTNWMKYYEANPRIFFSHKQSELPIGSARDPLTGACTVEIFPSERLSATAFFHLKTDESRDVWELVRARELEMTSVGFLPHKAIVLPWEDEFPEGYEPSPGDLLDFDALARGLDFVEAELIEFSIVPIGANREALAERLAKGLIKSPLVRRSLSSYAPAKKAWSPGFTASSQPSLSSEDRTALSQPPFNYSLDQIKRLSMSDVRTLLNKPKHDAGEEKETVAVTPVVVVEEAVVLSQEVNDEQPPLTLQSAINNLLTIAHAAREQLAEQGASLTDEILSGVIAHLENTISITKDLTDISQSAKKNVSTSPALLPSPTLISAKAASPVADNKTKDEDVVAPEDDKPTDDKDHPVVKALDSMAECLKDLTDVHKSTHEMVKAMHGVVCAESEDEKEESMDEDDDEEKSKDEDEDDDDEDDEPKNRKAKKRAPKGKKKKSPTGLSKVLDAILALKKEQDALREILFEATGK